MLESQEGPRFTEVVNAVWALEGVRKPRRITDIQTELRTRIYEVRGRSANWAEWLMNQCM